jgi:nucleoside-diphosphate-sugar epimerase
MKNIALIGAAGFVGSQIASAIIANGHYNLIPILRKDNAQNMIVTADIIVHCANPAKRWKAEHHPEHDFEETVGKTAQMFTWSYGKRFILISSLSCRTQLYTHYGRHRRACELIVLTSNSSLVIRLGPMFGGERKEDMLHDILAGRNVFVSSETQYAYANVEWVGQRVCELIDGPNGIKEIGARNAVRLSDIRDKFHTKTIFSGLDETQIPENCSDGPDAFDVFEFAKRISNA